MLVAYGDLAVFTGNAHPELAGAICSYLKIPLGKAEVFKFNNDNTFVRILENVRQRDVFIVQPTVAPVNDHIMEMLIFVDAAKRASAGRISAVLPYYSYARTDKKDQPRVPITGRLVADLIETAGVNRVITVDLHAGQVQGFFSVPVDELTALPKLVKYFQEKELKDPVVVATDIGISKRARDFASRLDAPLAIVEKRRLGNVDRAEGLNIIGTVDGMPAVLFDDEINTGSSMMSAAALLTKGGATEIYACATHGVLPGEAAKKLSGVPEIKEIVITDTVPLTPEKKTGKIMVLTISDLVGEAIYRIHNGLSVGAMFT
ncbi:MAG: ribose-phosphate pyrophosphokinase [Chloroflexi bacterium]|nr:ribose-phosphate pyrophosphokinase [Chloroflexota bacterium]